MEPIITTIVNRDIESSLDLITSFFIAKLSDAEKIKVGALISDCADEASALGLNVHEKLFRFAEVLWGGAAVGTEEMAETCATKTVALLIGYDEQKKVNAHRASISPEWQRLANSNSPVEASAVEVLAVEGPAEPSTSTEIPAIVVGPVEVATAPAVEAPAEPSTSTEIPAVVVGPVEVATAPAVEAPAETVIEVETPAVRRRQKSRLRRKPVGH